MKKSLIAFSTLVVLLGASSCAFAGQAVIPQTAGVASQTQLLDIAAFTLVVNNQTSSPKVINLMNEQGNGLVTLNKVDTIIVPPNTMLVGPVFWGIQNPTTSSALQVGLVVNGVVAHDIFQFVSDPVNPLQHYVMYNSNAMYNFGKFNVCTTQMGNGIMEIDIN
ncbi:MAG: hypothetical protein NTX05_04360 [Fusobacteria bacterium]|nr:hypothetical protein [Fusobacteriota bacterium]